VYAYGTISLASSAADIAKAIEDNMEFQADKTIGDFCLIVLLNDYRSR